MDLPADNAGMSSAGARWRSAVGEGVEGGSGKTDEVSIADTSSSDRRLAEALRRRRAHAYFVDHGLKFAVSHRSAMIRDTDLFDLEKFGCRKRRPDRTKAPEGALHPAFVFADKFAKVGVHLEDLTTGEVRWDAVYDLGKGPVRSSAEMSDCIGGTGRMICPKEKPIGGSRPEFLPDWCPAPTDAAAHRYRLAIRNLSPHDHPEQPLVGEMFFTLYGPRQLAGTYAAEDSYKPLSL